uniref:Uncharacterized protein n=1 Tax=Mola mola TaxID=94237 RepID=A0A3Q3WVY6_MOLML
MYHLKSAISISGADDTSLALPSVNQYRSGEQRVLDQVQTIRRNKSRHYSTRSGSSSLSPTSNENTSIFWLLQLSTGKSTNRQITNTMKGSAVRRDTKSSNFLYKRDYARSGFMAVSQVHTCRSEPNLAWKGSVPKRSVVTQQLPSKTNSHFTMSSNPKLRPLYTQKGKERTKKHSSFICTQADVSKTSSKPVATELWLCFVSYRSNVNGKVADITLKEAVEYLSKKEKTYQHCGASYIQHNTFIDENAKEEVLKLNGIPPLVGLLRSPSAEVHHTASAALRNLSFKNNKNKEEIHRCGGITDAVALLRETDSVDVQKQLTGLLWNLSSFDSLKPDLLQSALPVLVELVILPHTARSEHAVSDAEAFFHTTGCLRNLSSTKQSNRQAMRKCQGLINSLVRYVKNCMEAGKPDDKSLENSVCILHNLTFQLEAEAPALFSWITALAKPVNQRPSQSEASPIACFSPQNKSQGQEHHFDLPLIEDPQPNEAGWLIHSKTLQSYLSLLGSSQQEETQEACCGALQNLTTNESTVSNVMSQTIVQKLNGLRVLSPLIKSNKVNLQRNIVALIGNLTKAPNLQSAIGKKQSQDWNESDDTLAMACQAANRLIMREPEMSKQLLTNNLINSLKALSQNTYFPKSRKAAALLLYNLWSEKDLQSFLKKQGMNKSSFVNDITTAALKSMQIVD